MQSRKNTISHCATTGNQYDNWHIISGYQHPRHSQDLSQLVSRDTISHTKAIVFHRSNFGLSPHKWQSLQLHKQKFTNAA